MPLTGDNNTLISTQHYIAHMKTHTDFHIKLVYCDKPAVFKNCLNEAKIYVRICCCCIQCIPHSNNPITKEKLSNVYSTVI